MTELSPNTIAVAADVLQRLGLELTETGKTNVFEALETGLRIDPVARRVTVSTDDGEVSPEDFVRGLAVEHSVYFRPAGSRDDLAGRKTEARQTDSFTRQMIAENRATRNNDARKQRAATIVAKVGNPWTAGSRNLTAQMTVSNLDPSLADRLVAEAEAFDD